MNAKFDANGNMTPKKTSCWRFAFRFHQRESKESNGFMIQVEEWEGKGLGDGQKMETEMARDVGLKVFRTYTNVTNLTVGMMSSISEAVKEWYDSGCANIDLENVFIGDVKLAHTKRPKYETL